MNATGNCTRYFNVDIDNKMAGCFVFSSKCSSAEYSLQDAGKYHSDANVGTAAKKPPQWAAAWLQGATALLMSLLTFMTTSGLAELYILVTG